MQDSLEQLKYPIGPFRFDAVIDSGTVEKWIDEMEVLPESLKAAVQGLTEQQLNTPYRPDGWTVRQVVHHIGDSHLNSYVRFKWTLTEEKPVIKPYFEDRWAELQDYQLLDIEVSLAFIEILHRKMVILFRALSDEQLDREFVHPESGETVPLRRNIGIYAWHGRHHVAHITALKKRMGW